MDILDDMGVSYEQKFFLKWTTLTNFEHSYTAIQKVGVSKILMKLILLFSKDFFELIKTDNFYLV